MKKIYFLLFTLSCILTTNAQLQSGDIAFTGYNSDGTDSFSFVTFVEIPANTVIIFTDNGWKAAGGFRSNEGTATWTSPAITIVAGTEILITDIGGTANFGTFVNSGINLSGSGDQVLAYDPNNIPDASDDSGFYAGINMNSSWDTDASSSNTSSQPASLVGFSIALSPEVDNAVYDCSTTTGNTATLRAAINDTSNWTTDNNSGLTLPTCNFTATLSVNQNKVAAFYVYPNPVTNGTVNIKTSNNEAVNVSIFDVLGKQVLAKNVTNQTLNVSNLNAGVYILKLSQNGNSTTKKLVIN
ncbi:T9SS type A sorting domain-containing protein [Lacinutrix himadriensis]|uniref:T9SS type A sorting domain-containing protein n=1 Tax=Lacinutrix himadriensis TaxID=641549 RepID=UPI0006E1DDDA|nr:T9SS type A sorting domain-containing protein [Lacinutrix himadriensis]